jgi:Putative Ig domain
MDPSLQFRSSSRGVQVFFVLCIMFACHFSLAQVAIEELGISDTPMAKAFVRQPYERKLTGKGGVPPLHWQLSGGDLPDGLTLADDGTVTGKPEKAGEFHFQATVNDSSHPPHEKNQEFVLTVAIPLEIEWSHPPKVNGHRIEGSIKTSNGTEEEFDLTVVIVAVNEDGRATALGYQRIPLQKEQIDKEIPFGENLPSGTYVVNADAVGEVAASNHIFRARLVSDKLTVQPDQ